MLNNNKKYCREKLEMTQTELDISSSKQIISNWETGYNYMDYLLGRSNSMYINGTKAKN